MRKTHTCGTWLRQCDGKHRGGEFESLEFRDVNRVYFIHQYQLLTLDDYLFGTRDTENAVKLLSSRTDDVKGHMEDCVEDELLRVTMEIRFRRSGESDVNAPTRWIQNTNSEV